MKTYSSIHNLNADKGLGRFGKLLWSLLNYLNNSYFPNKSKNLCMVNFCPEINEYDWKKNHSKSSPYRALSNLFWLKLDWRAIKSELGGINVFDTGAGKGGYALKLNDFAQGITAYFGVDLSQHEEWKNTMHENAFITLKQQTSNDILDSIPNETNFFMSQSAIEHFEHDLLYFEQIKNFIDKSKKNIIQIHLFPSAACLKLFPWHGVRQYTPRTISTIVQLFDSPNVYSMLFRIGGDNCNNLRVSCKKIFQTIFSMPQHRGNPVIFQTGPAFTLKNRDFNCYLHILNATIL